MIEKKSKKYDPIRHAASKRAQKIPNIPQPRKYLFINFPKTKS
jgi:hypothetical protein